MQRKEFAGPGWHDLEVAGRETCQRRRSPRRHREWTSSASHLHGNYKKDWNLLPSSEDTLMRARGRAARTTQQKLARARTAASKLALLSTNEKNSLLSA